MADDCWPTGSTAAMTSLHIASFIVRTRPEAASEVASRIAQMPGAEIHAVESGKIIVVVEAESERVLADYMEELRGALDVLMVSLVFHQVDAEMPPEGISPATVMEPT
jgi:nitrate reductase NapD